MTSSTTQTIELSYSPTATQAKAHRCNATYILFGGAVGGGKGTMIVNDALAYCLRWPGVRVGLFRWEASSFRKTTYQTLKQWVLDVPGLVADHAQSKNEITLINGSQITYGGLKPSRSQSGDELSTIRSLELGAVYIDEAADLPENVFNFLASRVGRSRCSDGTYPPPRIVLTANPHLGWVRHRFVDSRQPDHAFIQSRVSDNPYLPADYERRLREQWISNPAVAEALLDGDWSAIVDSEAIFPAELLLQATRTLAVPTPESTVAFGVDVAAYGTDSTVVVLRRGMSSKILWEARRQDTMTTVNQIAMLADRHRPQVIRIDSIGVGQGVHDRLLELGYPVFACVGGERPDDERFANARAEWYFNLRGLLEAGKVSLPDRPDVLNELGSIKFLLSQTDRTLLVEGKNLIRKRLGKSPDYADAFVYSYIGAGVDCPMAYDFSRR